MLVFNVGGVFCWFLFALSEFAFRGCNLHLGDDDFSRQRKIAWCVFWEPAVASRVEYHGPTAAFGLVSLDRRALLGLSSVRRLNWKPLFCIRAAVTAMVITEHHAPLDQKVCLETRSLPCSWNSQPPAGVRWDSTTAIIMLVIACFLGQLSSDLKSLPCFFLLSLYAFPFWVNTFLDFLTMLQSPYYPNELWVTGESRRQPRTSSSQLKEMLYMRGKKKPTTMSCRAWEAHCTKRRRNTESEWRLGEVELQVSL